ncbi:hypothetical protein [Oribacterium sp. P6A1]|uniref:hypothetical protein n=1 Tax=Oribacterium sp. P6A1 TaxID=1410612 RepID=UPI000568C766|nr:hypothetical protein [Oribacterium sp. P6A1]
MKLNNTLKAMVAAVTLSTLVSLPAMADWQYTLYGPMAVWTNTVTGEQTTVYAGQPAPDGTPAPTLTLTQENTKETYDVNAAIAAANAAVDAAKAARGGNTTGNTLTSEQLAANTAAANANLNTNTVTVINGVSSGSKSGSLSNAELPMIATGDQSSSSGIADGSYVGPGNSVSAKISGTKGVSTQLTSYVASDGHLVTNAQAPDLSAASTASDSTSGNTSSSVPGGSTASAAASTPSGTGSSAVNYTGTLPSTGSSNINTYSTPEAGV